MLIRYEDYVNKIRYTDISSKKDGSLDVYDEEAVNASIINIILTYPGSIPFNLSFGVGLGSFIFEAMNESDVRDYMNKLLDAVNVYEQRVLLDRNSVEVTISTESQTVDLYIPYTFKETGLPGQFYKRLAPV